MLARLLNTNGRIHYATASERQATLRLAAALLVVCLISASPALPHLNLTAAPNWARLLLLLTVMQVAFVLWMLTVPDWSSLWVVMIAFAVGAAFDGMGLAISLATPADRPLALGLEAYRHWSTAWCGCLMLLLGGSASACGWLSFRWRKRLHSAH